MTRSPLASYTYGDSAYPATSSGGTAWTAKGFTGQRADAATGLDYYNARYYDAVAGQFTSADTVASGLSPYAYVRGNPETFTDPTGHRRCNPSDPSQCGPPPGGGGGGGGGHGHPPIPPSTCTPTGGAKACLNHSTPPPTYDSYYCQVGSGEQACDVHQMLNRDIAIIAGIGILLTLIAAIVSPMWWLTILIGTAIAAVAALGIVLGVENGNPDAWFTAQNVDSLAGEVGKYLTAFVAVTAIVGSILTTTGVGVTIGGSVKIMGLIVGVGIGGLVERMFARQEEVLNGSSDLNPVF